MAEGDKIVPAYEITKFARDAFDAAGRKANELKALYLSKGINQKSVKEAVSTIEPDLHLGGRNANEIANTARQSLWGNVPITKEEVDRLVPKEEK